MINIVALLVTTGVLLASVLFVKRTLNAPMDATDWGLVAFGSLAAFVVLHLFPLR
ncbi:hypothetical protein [Ktedonobacter robiniae]|nr:hypothetical protein [Ktedonobacter robiniae]